MKLPFESAMVRMKSLVSGNAERVDGTVPSAKRTWSIPCLPNVCISESQEAIRGMAAKNDKITFFIVLKFAANIAQIPILPFKNSQKVILKKIFRKNRTPEANRTPIVGTGIRNSIH